ncbi:hypothetical protein HXX76_014053 [Chlamydomonas incerta]|uniref:Uncharacterized protein n=1 Tax=Chlamydomonas incerta TaxID=51695 RepID=A0A835SQU0_CHLIN|nr:hypothetical protein HXX76_014053 [Chlamydomonas incerta]|eukprot:KAG2424895.1 hypothetical protein HXX76_014053 [Chlamydomonas incerta]
MNCQKPVLYYSRFCKHSSDTITFIEKAGLVRAFLSFCVDGRLQQLPPQVTVVPTIQYCDHFYTEDSLESFLYTIKADLCADPCGGFERGGPGAPSYAPFIDADDALLEASSPFMPLGQLRNDPDLPPAPSSLPTGDVRLGSVTVENLERFRDEEVKYILKAQSQDAGPPTPIQLTGQRGA